MDNPAHLPLFTPNPGKSPKPGRALKVEALSHGEGRIWTLQSRKPRLRTDTGTCAICFLPGKLSTGTRLVHHGFRISDGFGRYFGFRSGRCFGCDHLPYELSCEANRLYRRALESALGKNRRRLLSLQSGAVRVLHWTERVADGDGNYADRLFFCSAGETRWAEVLDEAVRRTGSEIDACLSEIVRQSLLIRIWELKTLPGAKTGAKIEAETG